MRIDMATAARILGCEGQGFVEVAATGASYDTRLIRPGDLFIGLKGEGVDGSRFAADAAAKGAAFFIFNVEVAPVEGISSDRVLYVPDTYDAFFKLSAWWRAQLEIPFVGVTGSAGKTTVRDMVAHILSRTGKGAASSKNYNNHIGVPYTLCRIQREDAWAVVEMGMNHLGEISRLSRLGRPDVAVITGVGPAHIGFLGSLENIARAKLEIVDGLTAEGALVVPLENETLNEVMRERKVRERCRVFTFGGAPEADAHAYGYQQRGLDGIRFTLNVCGEVMDVSMDVLGRHNMFNAACAALVCRKLYPALSAGEIQAALETFVAPDMRLNLKQTPTGQTVIDDAYNANPASVQAALEIVRSLISTGRQVGVVLGDMFELGDHARRYHEEIARLVAEVQPAFVVAVGEDSRVMAEAAAAAGIAAISVLDAEDPKIMEFISRQRFEVVLVKGSRGVYLEKVTANLVK